MGVDEKFETKTETKTETKLYPIQPKQQYSSDSGYQFLNCFASIMTSMRSKLNSITKTSMRRNLHAGNLNEKYSLRGARSFSDVYMRFASSALAFPHVKSNVSMSTSVTDKNNQQPPSGSSMSNGIDEFSDADNADDIKLVSVEFHAGEKQLPPSSSRVGNCRLLSRRSSFTKVLC